MKKLYYLFRHFSGLNNLRLLFAKRSIPFVLCYHEVEEKELFAQLAKLKKSFLIKNINDLAPNDFGACAITLDDCLNRDAEIFFSVAEKLEIPVSFYLPVKYCIESKPLPGDLIKWMVQNKPKIKLGSQLLKSKSQAEKLIAKNTLTTYFYNEVKLGKDISDSMLKVFANNKIDSSEVPTEIEVINQSTVKRMANSKFISFESHSWSHPAFAILDEQTSRVELEKSSRIIKELTGKPVNSICYPFGSVNHTGVKVYELSKDYYKNGVTLEQDVWHNKDLFRIPRIGIYPGDKIVGFISKIFHYQDVYFINWKRK
jgi:peptidoglycan/xylan/chitin deacetylase (PgdA/CDA1 family)